MTDSPNDKPTTVLDYLPLALGRAAVDVCLSAFPLHLAAINFAASLTGKYISIRNEKQVQELLDSLKTKLDKLESERIIIKENLKQHAAYQEVAHKRLSTVSALDSKDDLELSANLIALCGVLTGENPKDKYLLETLGEISLNEFRLFVLGYKKRQQFEKSKSEFTEDKSISDENKLMYQISIDFFNEGEKLLGLYNFTHIIGKLHTLGLIDAPKIDGFSNYHTPLNPQVYPPEFTPIGHYFIAQLSRVGL